MPPHPLRDITRGPQAGLSLWNVLQKVGYHGTLCDMEKSREGGILWIHDDGISTGLGSLKRLMAMSQSVHQQEDTWQLCLPQDMLCYTAEVAPKGSFSNWGTRSPRTWGI